MPSETHVFIRPFIGVITFLTTIVWGKTLWGQKSLYNSQPLELTNQLIKKNTDILNTNQKDSEALELPN